MQKKPCAWTGRFDPKCRGATNYCSETRVFDAVGRHVLTWRKPSTSLSPTKKVNDAGYQQSYPHYPQNKNLGSAVIVPVISIN